MSRINTERFAGTCAQLALGRAVPSNGSLSAAAYLASFIARGARVPRYLVRDTFILLGDHLTKLRRTHENTCRGPDLSRYSLFYSIAQAMMYIFCFRWRDLIATNDRITEADLEDYDVFALGEPPWIPGIKESLTQNIYSRLNPLKVCSPTVVNQFTAVASHLKFMFLYGLLETNKRLRLSSYRFSSSSTSAAQNRESALSGKAGEGHHQLDGFFPFDPYQLPRSKRWLEGDYLVWKGVPGMQKEEESEDEDDESEAGDDVDDAESASGNEVEDDVEVDSESS